MTVNIPTDAKDIALHFYAKTKTPVGSGIARTIKSAKGMLENGYLKQDIIDVINYTVDIKRQHLYSYGFIVKCIDVLLDELHTHREVERLKERMSKPAREVISDGLSTERNRSKANRFGAKSRFGEELNFDLLKK